MWIRTKAEPVWDHGRVVQVVGNIMDITDLKTLELERRTSADRYSILSGSGDGFCVLQILFDETYDPPRSVDYRFIDANAAFEENTGLRHALGHTALELVPDLEREWIERYARVALTGKPEHFEDTSEAMGRVFKVDAFRVGEPAHRHVAPLFREISFRRRQDQRIASLLREKGLLLRETHHRIKNNMNTIQSLLSLQAEKLTEASSHSAIKNAESQIQSMMVLYEKLYQSETQQEASIADYLPPLVEEITAIFTAAGTITTRATAEEIVLDAHRLSAIGIILNELITNSVKYVFSGVEDPTITVSAHTEGDSLVMRYRDNGASLPGTVSFTDSDGFGMQLIEALLERLGADATIHRGAGMHLEFRLS